MNLRRQSTHVPVRLSLCAAAMLALAACGDGGTAVATEPTTSPSPSETPAPRLIPYAGGESQGVEVQVQADANDLVGAPASFQQFIGQAAQRITDRSTCTGGYVGITVETLRTDGFASGGVNDCGGYAALWAVVDGHWKEIQATQEAWDCAALAQYEVPSDVAGETCFDYDAQTERTYQQG